MNLFKRKQDMPDGAPAMPPELNDYYQAEKRQQTIVTWLLGFATLAITVAIAFGLFLSARWIVQKVRKTPAKAPETTQQPAASTTPSATPTPSGTTQPGTAGSTTQTTPTSGGPQTSSITTNLPNTGPTETLAVFFVATTAGVFAYKLRSRRV
jgi:hypothetical protein